MDAEDVQRMIAVLRACRTDLSDVEAMAAIGGLPKSVRETLSAFSNDHGGTLILGLDENDDFGLSPDFRADRIYDALASTCANEMEPPIRAAIDIVQLDGGSVVVTEIPELDPRYKPCYVKSRGEYGGSFTRVGDGDRRLTDLDIHLLHTTRGNPKDDRQPVQDAKITDLDQDALESLIRRIRQRHHRVFAGLDDLNLLQRLNVLVPGASGGLVPSFAALLVLGIFLQQFFPQLNATFVAYPGLSAEDIPANGPRFLDNRTLDGSIPYIVEEAISPVLRNSSMRSYVEGVGRRDVFDYPIEAVREAIVNALIHRDYSPYSRGTPVQIQLFADRLVISNPGGLFGAVAEDDLGGEGISSTRNPVFVKLLQDVWLPGQERTVCENRASGIPTMLREMRNAGSGLPEFDNKISRFKVILPRQPLLNPRVAEWIDSFSDVTLSFHQKMIMAQLHQDRSVTIQTARNLGLDMRTASRELTDLVNRGLLTKIGEHRYVLTPTQDRSQLEKTKSVGDDDRKALIINALLTAKELSRRDLEKATGLSSAIIFRTLTEMIAEGRVVATAPVKSPLRRYRLAN